MQDPQELKPYRTVGGEGRSETVIQKSRFLGYCYPVESEAAASALLSSLRKRHWDARHICYAYRIQWNGGLSRSSDDGEPSGTAGAPILNALNRAGLQNALCAVARYFGGVLLGTGGLTRAYGGAAALAIAQAGLVEMRVCQTLCIQASYARYAAIEPILRAKGYAFTPAFADAVQIVCIVPEAECGALTTLLNDRTDGDIAIMPTERTLARFAIDAGKQDG